MNTDPLFTSFINNDAEFLKQTVEGSDVDISQMAYFLNCIGLPINYIYLTRDEINVVFVTVDCPTIIMNAQGVHFQAIINQPAQILKLDEFVDQLNELKTEFPIEDNSNLLDELYCLYILSGWKEDPIRYALTVHTHMQYKFTQPKHYTLPLPIAKTTTKQGTAADKPATKPNPTKTPSESETVALKCEGFTQLGNGSDCYSECGNPSVQTTVKKIRPTYVSSTTQTSEINRKRDLQTRVSILQTIPLNPTTHQYYYQKCTIFAEDLKVFTEHPILKKFFWTEKNQKPKNTKDSKVSHEPEDNTKPDTKSVTSHYTLLTNTKSTNAHMDLANLRQLFETTNLNALADDHRLTMRVNNNHYQLYELIDVGSSPRMINRNIQCTFLIPTLDSMGDYSRINGRKRAIMENQQPYKTYVEETFQEYCESNDMTISLPSTTGTNIKYNKIFNFTDSIYYIDDHDLGQAFMRSSIGLVAVGTMHVFKHSGPVQLNKRSMGEVNSIDNEYMEMQVDGNAHTYTHPKRFQNLGRNDSHVIDVNQNINGISTTLFTLLIEVKLRVNCTATDYISFSITKMPPTNVKPVRRTFKQCHKCAVNAHTDPSFGQQYATVPDHTDLTGALCKGTALCMPCLTEYIHHDLKVYTPSCLVCKKAHSYIFHGIDTPTVTAYNYQVAKGIDTCMRMTSGFSQEGKKMREDEEKKKRESEIEVNSEAQIMYYRSKHLSQATLIQRVSLNTLQDIVSDNSSNNFITADGAAVVAIKQAGCIATFMYDDLTITDTTTWASYKHIIPNSIFLVDAMSLQKTIRTSMSSYNPTNHKDLVTLTQLVLSNANELPPRCAAAVVVHIMKLHLDLHLELTKISESLLAKTLQDAIDGKFTYKKPSLVRSVLTQFKWNKRNRADICEDYHKDHNALFFNKEFNYTNFDDENPFPNYRNHKVIDAGGEETTGFIGTKPPKDDDGDGDHKDDKGKKTAQKGRTKLERQMDEDEEAMKKRFLKDGYMDMMKAQTHNTNTKQKQQKNLTYNPAFNKLLDIHDGEAKPQL